jgi:hypothetical protein
LGIEKLELPFSCSIVEVLAAPWVAAPQDIEQGGEKENSRHRTALRIRVLVQFLTTKYHKVGVLSHLKSVNCLSTRKLKTHKDRPGTHQVD